MKFEFIKINRKVYPVWLMAKILRVSPSGFYDWDRRGTSRRQQREYELARVIEDIHEGSRKTYGSPRIFRMLKALGHRCKKSTVERLMRKYGIFAKRRRKFRKTTQSKHDHPIAENILQRDFKAEGPNKVWASDITYVETAEGWLYLAVILDLFNRQVVGWAMSKRINEELTLSALHMAIERRRPKPGLIHHSDRGSQYAAKRYRRLLEAIKARPSMSRKGDCWDNSVVESFFGTLKSEFIHRCQFQTRREATSQIFEWIEVFYNRIRIHSTLGYLSPVQFESERKYA